jgi:sugar O-acyltransferase (sialic acid O-acetyltransferase NeuD family)
MVSNQSVDGIVVIGGGGHAKVVISVLRKLEQYRIVGYTDLKNNGALLGVPYLGSDSDLAGPDGRSQVLNAVLAVGQVRMGELRRDLWMRLHCLALSFPSIVSPGAIVNEEVSVGDAAVVMDGAVINTGATIGRGTIVNTNSTVEHDVLLDEWVHIAPAATVCGGVTVGRFSLIGAGATVTEGLNIAPCCIVGAGATVVHDLTQAGTYVGCPAHRVK